MMEIYVGTRNGVGRVSGDAIEPLGLTGKRIWALHSWHDASAGEDVVLAGSYGEGMFRSSDSGQTWNLIESGLTAATFRTIEPNPIGNGEILAGTEPARGFRSTDGGISWLAYDAIPGINSAGQWFLPYSPRLGALRNFASSTDGTLYASVEVGGLLTSADGGVSWRLINVDPGPRVHDDIHCVVADPANQTRLYVAMGGALVDRTHPSWAGEPRRIGGVAVSEDRGATWRKLRSEYTRALWIPSSAPDWLIAGPAARTGEGGWIVGSLDRGKTWTTISDGIKIPQEDMVERFTESPDGRIWALCSGGGVYAAEPGDWQWSSLLPGSRSCIIESIAFAGRQT